MNNRNLFYFSLSLFLSYYNNNNPFIRSINALPTSKVQTSLLPAALCPSISITALCHNETQQECPKDLDDHGCFHGNYCYPKTVLGGNCSMICPPVCNQNEIFCKGKEEGNCPGNDVCIDKFNKGCRNYCPVFCDAFKEIHCKGVHGSDGCKLAELCIPLGEKCPEDQYDAYACVLLKDPLCNSSETLCHGGYDHRGCQKNSICVELKSKTTPALNGREGCPTFCPPICTPGIEVLCPPTYDEDGCQLPPLCKMFSAECPETKYQSGSGCPVPSSSDCENYNLQQICHREPIQKSHLTSSFISELHIQSASFHPLSRIQDPMCDLGTVCIDKIDDFSKCPNYCQVHCNNDSEIYCSGVYDENGCMGPQTCIPKTETCPQNEYDVNGCYIHEDVYCSSSEVKCKGIRDSRACLSKSTCIPQKGECKCPEEEFDSHGCPILTLNSLNCAPNHMLCSKGVSQRGCDRGFECIPSQVNGCPNTCPVYCKEDEQHCKVQSSHRDSDSDECSDSFTYECIALVDEAHCPLFCSPLCDMVNLHPCPPIYNSAGCQVGPQTCVNDTAQCPTSSYDEFGCPIIHQITSCDEPSMKLCLGGTDSEGCERRNICIPKETPEGHEIHCPVLCGKGQMSCSTGTYKGLPLGEICVASNAHANLLPHTECDTHCPPACDWYSQKACSGGYNKATGCPHQDICVNKEESCKLYK